MELTTAIEIATSACGFTHRQPFLLLGSCFADNIGSRLRNDGYDCMVNPFGTLYNPASIALHLRRCMDETPFCPEDTELLLRPLREGDPWQSWLHHSCFGAATAELLLERMNTTQKQVAQQIRKARWLVVTFGTAYIYRLADTDMLVANCHRQPDRLFCRSRMSAEDITGMWTPLLQELHSLNPELHVLFTVSPVRHRRDGLHASQLSKAELLLAVDTLVSQYTDFVHYFPAYEILLDELRDYRFYADDMLHPSPLAADYIYERLCHTFVGHEEQLLSERVRKIRAALAHRPFNPDSPSHRQFVEKTQQQLSELLKELTHLTVKNFTAP